MIESPLIQEIMARTRQGTLQEATLRLLGARFGTVPADLAAQVRALLDEQTLEELNTYAGLCPNLEAFRGRLQS